MIHNVQNFRVKQKVESIFTSLRAAGPMQKTHPMYRKQVAWSVRECFSSYAVPSYAFARDIGYLEAVVEYDTKAEVVIQDLVQLLHERRDEKQPPPLRLPRIMDIHFKSPSEIPALLASRFVAAHPGLGAEPPTSDPRAGDVSQTERVEDEEKIGPEEPIVEPVDEVHEVPPDEVHEEPEPRELTSGSDKLGLVREHEPTEQEISAIKRIQAVYRLYRKRRDNRARAIRGLKAQQNIIFMACLRNVLASRWGKTPYRTLYLWALPHLVVCLDNAIAVAHEVKSKTKRQLLEGNHDRLEDLAKQTTVIK